MGIDCSRFQKIVLTVLMALLLTPSLAFAAPTKPYSKKLNNYISKTLKKFGSHTTIGVKVYDVEKGRTIYDYNSSKQMVPASVVKVLTSVAALKLLGSNYKFPTELFVDRLPQQSSNAGNLYVRGYGDPSLVSERLWALVRYIKRLGLKNINDIVMDDTLFINPKGPSGHKPYQAGLSATSLNHNCYSLTAVPTQAGKKVRAYLQDGAPFKLVNTAMTTKGSRIKLILGQNPRSSSLASRKNQPVVLSAKVPTVNLKGKLGVKAKARTYYRTVPHPPLYFGAMLKYMLEKEGIKVSGSIRKAETPAHAQLLHLHESRDLASIVRDLNHYSNNFIAGQILFTLGQDSNGYFRSDYGLKRIEQYMAEIGIDSQTYAIHDGSGLDKKNRLNASQIVQVLQNAYDDFAVSPYFISSLSRFGHTGTLKKRVLNKGMSHTMMNLVRSDLADSVWGKTGTLTHVSSVAGYAKSSSDSTIAYAVLVNGKLSKDTASEIEDKIMKIIIGGKN